MIIFFSGGPAEDFANTDVHVMTTFFNQFKRNKETKKLELKPDKRIVRLKKQRKK